MNPRKIPKIRRRYAISKPHRPSRRRTLDETIERDAESPEVFDLPPQKRDVVTVTIEERGSMRLLDTAPGPAVGSDRRG